MLYLLHGTDTQKARRKTHELIDSLKEKQPDASVQFIDAEAASDEMLADLAGSQGLFAQKVIVALDTLCADAEMRDVLLAKAPVLAESVNIFIILEGQLNKATSKALEAHAAKTQAFALPQAQKAPAEFNTFALADKLGERDRKQLWVLYQQAKQRQVSGEEIAGVFFWIVKTMLLARGAKTAKEAGLKQFPFTKGKKFARKYSETELHTLSRRLIILVHDARRGIHDLDNALERFILLV